MVVVTRSVKIGVRIIGDYRWERANGWIADVRKEDLLQVLTNPGFRVVGDDLAAVDGIDDARAEELLLLGIATFEQLMEESPTTLADSLSGIGARTVRDWQNAARDIVQAEEALDG
jgi:predicted flap endonuclease-1-like 5' DNA nuclease